MRHFYLASIASLLALTACNSTRKPSDTNFTKAINEYLAKHGNACTVISRTFPIDVPQSEQSEPYGIVPKLGALEQAGLVQATETTAAVHGMLDPLRGATPPRPVKRYELTAEGKKYAQVIPSALGETNALCYGHKTVESIVKWTEPTTVGPSIQTEVTYTYRIADAAAWTENPNVQQAFSDIRTTVNGASKTTDMAGLQLTSKGWAVPEQ